MMLKFGPILRPLALCQLQQPNAGSHAFISRRAHLERLLNFESRSFAHFSGPNFYPQAATPRTEAALIRARIPKKLSPQNVFVKENYGQAKKTAKKSTPIIFSGLIKEFKALTPSKLAEYEEKARTTQEAHKAAVSNLTAEEKAVLLADKRQRHLKKSILSAARKLVALKRQYSYPASCGTVFTLFTKEKSDQPEVKVAKTMTDRSRIIASMWKSLSETERQEYKKKLDEARQQARQNLTQWRRKMANTDDQSALAVGQIDDLRSELRKLRRKLTKMQNSGSIDEELEEGRRKVNKKLTAKRKPRKVLATKKLRKSAKSLKTKSKKSIKSTAARGRPAVRKKKSIKKKTEDTDDE